MASDRVRLPAVAAGDTVRWIIGDTESGSGPSKRVHILVKPTLLASVRQSALMAETAKQNEKLVVASTLPSLTSFGTELDPRRRRRG